MTATISNLGTRRLPRLMPLVRRGALAAGWLLAAIGSGWRRFVESGDMGPNVERSISRHTGARI